MPPKEWLDISHSINKHACHVNIKVVLPSSTAFCFVLILQGLSFFGDWWSVPSVSWFSRDLTPSFFQSLIPLSPYYKIAFLVSVVWFPKSIHIVSKGMLKGYLSSRHNHCALLKRHALSTLLFLFKHFYYWNF